MTLAKENIVRVGVARPALVGTNTGNVVLELARERRAHPGGDAPVGAVAREASVGADEDVGIGLLSAGLQIEDVSGLFSVAETRARTWTAGEPVAAPFAAATAAARTAAKASLNCMAMRARS